MQTPGRGDAALRRHRVSRPGASYFLTLCTDQRTPGLTAPAIARALRDECQAIERDAHWRQRAAVIMPDHLHVLVCLTGRLEISRCVARLKTKTKLVLNAARLVWQTNFYEHRLRAGDPVEAVVRYIFLNPDHAALVPPGETYPHFWLGESESAWFTPTTDIGRPFPEWLR